ncbi:DUF3077 domain-containing protein [Pseudomonas gingeri]|nr:DUF3077 domain-containing protein [Pseudomonas gingeri]NWA14341.1 DUF3077 domain-containing protein [Pseudomonas gingeri]NWA55041.1 DUF3077 domain-containing protein [Pseudomonas gingeri]NWA94765.1 DUF3077 domain-containing protein [Pseudomonas gingeri]NWB01421.1 DUF3077 domain-containing protein [Pseudomonas gingeri]
MHKKIVPDPPCTSPALIIEKSEVLLSQKKSLFSVREDINLQDALTSVSQLLKTAEYVADDISTGANGIASDQIWTVTHSVEMARAMVDALLERPRRLTI